MPLVLLTTPSAAFVAAAAFAVLTILIAVVVSLAGVRSLQARAIAG